MTPNRSAGRIDDTLWVPFKRRARELGLSNTAAFRQAMRQWLGMPEPDPPEEEPGST